MKANQQPAQKINRLSTSVNLILAFCLEECVINFAAH